jgi:hypothetical protein
MNHINYDHLLLKLKFGRGGLFSNIFKRLIVERQGSSSRSGQQVNLQFCSLAAAAILILLHN